MKKLLAIFAALSYVITTEAQNPIELSSHNHNFGKIEEMGGDVHCEFVVKNISTEPIVISHMRTNCSCIATRYSRKPIAPNEVDTLRVDFDPRFRAGVFNKNISLHIAGHEPIKLTVTGEVNPRTTNTKVPKSYIK